MNEIWQSRLSNSLPKTTISKLYINEPFQQIIQNITLFWSRFANLCSFFAKIAALFRKLKSVISLFLSHFADFINFLVFVGFSLKLPLAPLTPMRRRRSQRKADRSKKTGNSKESLPKIASGKIGRTWRKIKQNLPHSQQNRKSHPSKVALSVKFMRKWVHMPDRHIIFSLRS